MEERRRNLLLAELTGLLLSGSRGLNLEHHGVMCDLLLFREFEAMGIGTRLRYYLTHYRDLR